MLDGAMMHPDDYTDERRNPSGLDKKPLAILETLRAFAALIPNHKEDIKL